MIDDLTVEWYTVGTNKKKTTKAIERNMKRTVDVYTVLQCKKPIIVLRHIPCVILLKPIITT